MPNSLRILHQPAMTDARMILAFTGWMDGGDVSTGAIDHLRTQLNAKPVANIPSDKFYIYNVPGTMEIAALFRPHTIIEDGLIKTYKEPKNRFFADETNNIVLFEGKEPNIAWNDYAGAIFEMVELCKVRMILFGGSVAATVPHTRAPRFHSSVSMADMKPWLEANDILFSNYEGPASFITYLLVECRRRGIQMATLVAEIPAYVQGRNAKVIEAMCRKLCKLVDVRVELDDLRLAGDEFERRLSAVVQEREDLAKLIRKIEHDYDREILNSQEDELKEWFEKQDIWLD